MTTALLSNTALLSAIQDTPEYRALVVKFQQDAQDAITSGTYEVKSLGVTMTLPQVAITYQAYKGIPKSFGANARSFTESISRECLAIIKKAGFRADWEGIQALASHA
jgi:hypothetical protein